MSSYYLMHKDLICGTMLVADDDASLMGYHDAGNGASPYLGMATLENMKVWWKNRAIPSGRDHIKALVHQLSVTGSEDYLAKNLALSVTDTYWICPVDVQLRYEDINFFSLKDYGDGRIPFHHLSSYDPNASLGGQMEKYWDLNDEVPVLVKEGYKYYGQQSVNEYLATKIHEAQDNGILYTRYTCEDTDDGGKACKCKAFSSPDVEFVSAYEVLGSRKVSNDQSGYEAFIDICVEHGIDRAQIQEYMDYQTAIDFIISNTDEHLLNFGVLRDANTMRLLAPAPIFDSGNSMFFADVMKRPFTRVELLGREITSFYKTEEKMLAHVRNRNVVKLDLLPSPREIKDIYCSYGMPEERAEVIASNYETKVAMFRDFQKGMTISLFHEKKANL